MSQKVFVVTNLELGWDCVVAVYSSREAAEKYKAGERQIVITEMYVEDEFEE